MRILLATSRLEFEAGSEVWTLTMLSALASLGHSVDVFTVGSDNYSNRPPDFTKPYDVAIISHNTTLRALSGRKIGKRIMVCHGIIPALEQPVSGADIYVSVSEETQRHLLAKGFANAVVRNPINCERFDGASPDEIKKVALMCSKNGAPLRGRAEQIVRTACKSLGLEFVFLNSATYSELPEHLRGVDVVIGAGRCILEAAACNRAVISFDYGDRPKCGYGAITRENFHRYRRDSFTGRIAGRNFSAEEIAAEINQARGGLRDLIVSQHSAERIAGQFIGLQ